MLLPLGCLVSSVGIVDRGGAVTGLEVLWWTVHVDVDSASPAAETRSVQSKGWVCVCQKWNAVHRGQNTHLRRV